MGSPRTVFPEVQSFTRAGFASVNLSDQEFEGIIGCSGPLMEVLDLVRAVAATDATVLIKGETGTGKELIASAIRAHSNRRERPFVKLNCAAIPAGLLESTLFGHEKGAFTGAIMRTAGRVEIADQGTLFLDEVGDIPLNWVIGGPNGAAARLGMKRTTLAYRLQKLGIQVVRRDARWDISRMRERGIHQA